MTDTPTLSPEIATMQRLTDAITEFRPSDRGKAARMVRDVVADMMAGGLDADAIERVTAYGVMLGEKAEAQALADKMRRTGEAGGTPAPPEPQPESQPEPYLPPDDVDDETPPTTGGIRRVTADDPVPGEPARTEA